MTEKNHSEKQTHDAVTSCQKLLPQEPSGGDVIFGFDGYVDNIRQVKASKDDEVGERISTLDDFGKEITSSAAANSSLSIPWMQKQQQTGGHVSHLARVYQGLDFDTTLLGMCGDPLLDIFEKEFSECTIYSLGQPGITDAIEFDDGKILLTENGDAAPLNWESLQSRVETPTLVNELNGVRLFGIGYWSAIPGLADVLDGLRKNVFPKLSDAPEHVLIDPANVRRLDRQKLNEMVTATHKLSEIVDLTVSANRVETKILAAKMGSSASGTLMADARTAFDLLGVDRFVGHSTTESVVVSERGTGRVLVETVDSPQSVTGAGDHFNAGVGLGLIENLPDDAAVALGNTLAHEFVQTGETPTYDDLVSAVNSYDPEK